MPNISSDEGLSFPSSDSDRDTTFSDTDFDNENDASDHEKGDPKVVNRVEELLGEREESESETDETLRSETPIYLTVGTTGFDHNTGIGEALEAAQPKLKIRLPALSDRGKPGKDKPSDVNRKRGRADKPDSSESEDSVTHHRTRIRQSKKSRKCGAHRVMAARNGVQRKKNSQKLNGGELLIQPKKRGRPSKAAEAPHEKLFTVPVFVEIAKPPQLVRGKTHKGDKWVKQQPRTEGPFNLTQEMTWDTFLGEVSEVAGIVFEPSPNTLRRDSKCINDVFQFPALIKKL
jgi:hypothetical protein